MRSFRDKILEEEEKTGSQVLQAGTEKRVQGTSQQDKQL